MTLYILGMILIPLFFMLGGCEWSFNWVYRHSPRFRNWFDGLCEAADSWN